MNKSEPSSTILPPKTAAVPDYCRHDLLHPQWHHGASVRRRTMPHPESLAQPWMYADGSPGGRGRVAPRQLAKLWLLLLIGLPVAGFVEYNSLNRMDEAQTLFIRPLQAQTPALAKAAPQEHEMTDQELDKADVSQPSYRPTNTVALAATTLTGAQEQTPAPDTEIRQTAGVNAGSGISSAAPVTAALAIAALAVEPAVALPPQASMKFVPTSSQVTRSAAARPIQRANLSPSGAECSNALKAMQLCELTFGDGR